MSCDRGKKPWHQQLFWGVDGPRPQNVSCSLNQHPKPEESDSPLISAPTTSVIKLRTSFLFHLGPSKLSYFQKNFPIFQAVSGRYQDPNPIPQRLDQFFPAPQWKTIGSWLREKPLLVASASFVWNPTGLAFSKKKVRIPPCHWGICFLSRLISFLMTQWRFTKHSYAVCFLRSWHVMVWIL